MQTRLIAVTAAALLLSSAQAHGEWALAKTPGSPCPVEAGALPQHRTVWQNGNAAVTVCVELSEEGQGKARSEEKPDFTLSGRFLVFLKLAEASATLADETSIMTRPRRVRIRGDELEVTTLLSERGPALVREAIVCVDGHCTHRVPTCAIELPRSAAAARDELAKKLAKASDQQRLTLWASYFFDDQHPKESSAIILLAMKGDERAAALIGAEVGADGGPAEAQGQLVDDVTAFARLCAPPAP